MIPMRWRIRPVSISNGPAQGTRELLPERAYDDGEAVFLTWPQGTAIPAVLVTNEDGDEGPVNFTIRGETLVVDGVPPQIIPALRARHRHAHQYRSDRRLLPQRRG